MRQRWSEISWRESSIFSKPAASPTAYPRPRVDDGYARVAAIGGDQFGHPVHPGHFFILGRNGPAFFRIFHLPVSDSPS
jgi:hypothetical protein